MDAERRFRALFRETYPPLRAYAHHRGLRGADADDLVAAVLAVAWRRLDAVPTDDPLPWLFAVARNVWRNELRRRRRGRDLAGRLATATPTTTPAHDPGSVEPGAIRAALAALGEDDQELLRLIAWDGLTPRQAGAALGCSDAAARVRLHRARARLAAQLALRETGGPSPTVRADDDAPSEVPDGPRARP